MSPRRLLPILSLGVVVAIVAALASLPASAEEGRDPDPRVEWANGMLSDNTHWDDAIALYREALEDEPGHTTARMWLARVLAWKGEYDASLAEYAILIGQGGEIDRWEIERAEVLSWGGRYAEAEAGYEAILAQRPDDARALRGLARIYSWSGRRNQAVSAYERALAVQEDEEARAEFEKLIQGEPMLFDGGSRGARDSDGFQWWTVQTSGRRALTYRLRALYEVGYSDVRKDRAPGDPRIDATGGFNFIAGLEYDILDGLTGRVQAGLHHWAEAPDRPQVGGALDWTLDEYTVLGAGIDYGDFLSRSDSLDSLLSDIDQVSLRATAWRGFGPKWSTYGEFEASFVSDSNRRFAFSAAGSYAPLRDYQLRFSLAFSFLGYTERSTLYYDPEADLGITTSAQGEYPVFEWLDLLADVGIGFGYADEAGIQASGFVYRVRGGPRFKFWNWWLTVEGLRSSTIRARTYTVNGWAASLGREF